VHVIADPATHPRPHELRLHIFPQVDDRELLARLRQGDLSALEIIYERYARSVFQRCWRVLREREAAWEATQHTFIAFLAHLPGHGAESARDRLLDAAARTIAEISGEAARL
jgi:hypothetical protein